MSSTDLTGQILDGRYRVLGPLGEGAMGSVYRAEQLKLGRAVAIKVVNETLSSADPSARKRFEREARAMARLEHPHCATVLDVGVHGETPFVVMELVSGQSLKELVDQGPLPVPRAIEITRQVLSGLAHAHELGIVHRDIKPANIMLSQKAAVGDHVKILDFGLARMSGETSNLTAGIVLGTPSYMPPEQVRGILLDGRADLYACGVMLFELLTGEKPFRADVYDPIAVCMMHLSEPVPRLDARLPGRDFGALQAVVDRAMAKDREHRFQTAEQFVAALAEASSMGAERRVSGEAATAALPTSSLAPPTASLAPPTASLAPPSAALGPVNRHGATSFLGPSSSLPIPAPAPPPAAVAQAVSSTSASVIAPAPAARPRSRRAVLVAGAGIAAVVAVVAIVLATTGGNTSAVVVRDAGAVATTADAAAPAEDPVDAAATDTGADQVLARANELVAAGRDTAAIDLLVKSRRAHAKDARIPFLAGKLFARKMYFHDAFKHLRPAFDLDPSLRTDVELAESIVRGFNAKYSYDATIAKFLREEMPEAARPILERTAASHRNAMVRKRAAGELKRYP